MPQITFEETKYDEIIRLDTKDGWYNGNRMASAELPPYLLEPRGKSKPGIPTMDEEIAAYQKGYAEGMVARQEGKRGPENPYTRDNILRRMALE
jgi:hypothetical protein